MRKHLQIIIEDYIYQAIQLSRHLYLGLNISFGIRLTFYTVSIETHYCKRIIRIGHNALFPKIDYVGKWIWLYIIFEDIFSIGTFFYVLHSYSPKALHYTKEVSMNTNETFRIFKKLFLRFLLIRYIFKYMYKSVIFAWGVWVWFPPPPPCITAGIDML